jgi:hypothetical protein
LLCALAALSPAVAADEDCDVSRWIDATQEFCIVLPPDTPRSGLRVCLGHADVSLWFRIGETGQLKFLPGVVPLSSGAQDLIVRAPTGDRWREVARQPIKILTSGLERRVRRTTLNLSLTAQPDSGASGSAPNTGRERFNDVGMQAALGFELARSGAQWRFDSEIVGASYHNASLRYAARGERAPRVDRGQFSLPTLADIPRRWQATSQRAHIRCCC